jgi:hypothetical protein
LIGDEPKAMMTQPPVRTIMIAPRVAKRPRSTLIGFFGAGEGGGVGA